MTCGLLRPLIGRQPQDSTLDVGRRCPLVDWETVAGHDALNLRASTFVGD